MDSSEEFQQITLNSPYSVYFRINDQESFSVGNLSLSDYLRLLHEDQHTVDYIEALITAGAIKNTDKDINVISRSRDNVNFELIDLSLLHSEKSRISEGMILLEELETLSDVNVEETNSSTCSTSSTQNQTSESSESTSISAVSITTATCTTDSILKNRTSKMKSPVWNYFTKIDAMYARCQICTKTLKHDGNTTNLIHHLIRKHPTIKLDNTRNKQKTVRSRLSEKKDDSSKNTDAKMQKNVVRPAVGSDQRIDDVFRQVLSFADGGMSSEKITNAILYMLATDNYPLSTIENEGFRTFMKIIVPRYKIPSRRTITRYMDDKYIFAGRYNFGIAKTKLEL